MNVLESDDDLVCETHDMRILKGARADKLAEITSHPLEGHVYLINLFVADQRGDNLEGCKVKEGLDKFFY